MNAKQKKTLVMGILGGNSGEFWGHNAINGIDLLIICIMSTDCPIVADYRVGLCYLSDWTFH
jgi:hypothetical protein